MQVNHDDGESQGTQKQRLKKKKLIFEQNGDGMKKARLTHQSSSSQDSEGEASSSFDEQDKDMCAPKSKQIDESSLDGGSEEIEEDSVSNEDEDDDQESEENDDKGSQGEEENGSDEDDEEESKVEESNGSKEDDNQETEENDDKGSEVEEENSSDEDDEEESEVDEDNGLDEDDDGAKQSKSTPIQSIDKHIATQRNSPCKESKEDSRDDDHGEERQRKIEKVPVAKGVKSFRCLYIDTPEEEVNAPEAKEDSLIEGTEYDVKEDAEESQNGSAEPTKEQENESTSPVDSRNYIGGRVEVQESTSKAAKDVDDGDDVLTKTQKKPFDRLWTYQDEEILVKAVENYKAVHGKGPNNKDLANMIKGKLSFQPTTGQVGNKIRTMKKVKKKPSQRKTNSKSSETSFRCLSSMVREGKDVQSSEEQEKLKDNEIGNIVMSLFRGNEADELKNLEMSISMVQKLLVTGLSLKWKNMIKAQVKQYLRGLETRKAKLELFLQIMETATGGDDDGNDEE